MKKLSNISSSFQIKLIYVLMLSFAFLGCKKYFDPPDVFETQTEVKVKKRKVLLIGLDGITGEDMKTIAPPKVQTLLAHAKYTYNGVSDRPVSDAGSWTNIMTGVTVGKHGIVDSTFNISTEDLANDHDELAIYPSFIERLQGSGKMKYSAAITSWKKLSDELFISTDYPIVVANDELVKDSSLKMLSLEKMDLVIANFNGANKAGLEYGFDANVPQYKDAVLQLDTYIGQLVDGIKARKNYDKEDWLVIITSTHGGLNKGYTSGSNRESNIFSIYYQPDFAPQDLPQQPTLDGFNLPGKSVNAKLASANASAYNITDGDFTIQLKVNPRTNPSGNSVIFSKITHAYSSANGWEFMMENATKYFRVILGNGTGGNSPKVFLVGNIPAVLNQWYSLALKIYSENGKRYARFYNDGKPTGTGPTDITGISVGGTASDLVLGVISSATGENSQTISQVAFYNTALTDQAIQDFVCQQEITSADPYYNNLIGYWPCNEAIGNTFKNKAPAALGKDLVITNTGTTSAKWGAMAAWNCATIRQYLTRNSDISQQMFYWFGAQIDSKWATDGAVWLSAFEAEFIKAK